LRYWSKNARGRGQGTESPAGVGAGLSEELGRAVAGLTESWLAVKSILVVKVVLSFVSF